MRLVRGLRMAGSGEMLLDRLRRLPQPRLAGQATPRERLDPTAPDHLMEDRPTMRGVLLLAVVVPQSACGPLIVTEVSEAPRCVSGRHRRVDR
jgi:hypothetical protein